MLSGDFPKNQSIDTETEDPSKYIYPVNIVWLYPVIWLL